MLVRLFFCFLLIVSSFSASSEDIVTNDLVQEYINKVGLEKAIAQLFVVGIPTDYKNSAAANDFDELISDINVGGIMLNGYNLPYTELKKEERNTAFELASSLIRLIKQYDVGDENYPLLMYADFESYAFSSIKYPIIPPPSPLVLASTGDTKYSYYAGKVAGDQLRQLGVNVILGPVLDLDKSNQGNPNFAIATRAFSDNNKLIVSYAAAFLEGVNDTGISPFAKHFPTYGAVFTNAHKESSVYTGAIGQLEQDLYNFRALSSYFDGVMTSHLVVKAINESKPSTFNRELIDKYLSGNEDFNEKIIITDDLSNMESSKEYIKKRYRKFSYSKSALNAFKSGHDILLFSHITSGKGRKHSDFDLSQLKLSISDIKRLIEDDAIYMNQFKNSLRKIFKLKSKHVNSRVSNKLDFDSVQLFENESDFKSLNEFYMKTFDSAIIRLSKGDVVNLTNINQDSRVVFVGSEDAISHYKKYLDGEYQGHYIEVQSNYKSSKSFASAKKEILKITNSADVVVFIAETTDHINLIDNVRLNIANGLDKFIVFLHASPHLINYDLLNSVMIYGNFSKNPVSYLSDVKTLRGDIVPKEINYLPLSIASGSIHDSNNTKEPIVGGYISEEVIVFNTRYERELYDKIGKILNENSQLKIQNESLQKGNEIYTKINKSSMTFSVVWLILASFIITIVIVCKIGQDDCWKSIKKFFSLLKDDRCIKGVFIHKILVVFVLFALIYPSVGFFKVVIASVSELFPPIKPFLQYVLPPSEGNPNSKLTHDNSVSNK
ncbi:glycoside hydrolase family 3 protein [Shewanella algae]|uniref:glycoside hydrolase family 3 protein n=1 Tax=Shewanella algae TaxID=38313 RepID=UPI001AAD435C|nr:glycoside hydrolase family 3 protein [Shewanella algae]MBO2566733.1 glycoside hydrolase family 3 protein [Shewanella algae]